MRKDNIRDYATAAFRFYAALGCPSYEMVRTKLYEYILQEEKKAEIKIKGLGKPTEHAIINAQNAMEDFESELLDVMAVEKTMNILSMRSNGAEIIKAIRLVYFQQPKRKLEKGEISERVRYASLAIPADEATVYRYLKLARDIFAKERNLRNEKVASSRFKFYDIMVP